jgi:hypothetical protein
MRITINLERSMPYDDLILLNGEIGDYVTLELTKEKDSPLHEKKVSIILSPYDVRRLQRAFNALGE